MDSKCYLPDKLPSEIVNSILEYVPLAYLVHFGSTSKRAYDYATNFTWKDLLLRDRFGDHKLSSEEVEELDNHSSFGGIECDAVERQNSEYPHSFPYNTK